MASTFRSTLRCGRRSLTTASRTPVTTTRSFSVGEFSSSLRRQSQGNVPIRENVSRISISSRQASSSAAASSRRNEEPSQDRLEIPAFQFKDILPGGVLPITKSLKVTIDGKPFSFDNVFLRDSCTCRTCVDPNTQQKLFTTSDINLEIYPRRARIADGSLKIEWSHRLAKNAIPEANVNGLHWSHYDVDFLKNSTSNIRTVKTTMSDWRRITWDKKKMEKNVLWIDYEDYMNNEKALAKALKHLSLYGLIFIRNVPDGREVDQVPSLAQKIGNLKSTFYGDTWSVKSVPNSKNIAYTSLDLGLHMDLLYFESPPGLQFLHCVENSVTGGESYFADGFHGANVIKHSMPQAFNVLTRFPVNFHYKNDGRHYRFSRPIVIMKEASETYHPEGGIDHMNWAPPFQAPFTMDDKGKMISNSTEWRSFVKSMWGLNEQFENPQNQYELLLKEGDCVVFFNRRVLHARRAFDAQSGKRRLTGGYVDIDAFESACRVLAERYPEPGAEKVDDAGYEYLVAKQSGTQWA